MVLLILVESVHVIEIIRIMDFLNIDCCHALIRGVDSARLIDRLEKKKKDLSSGREAGSGGDDRTHGFPKDGRTRAACNANKPFLAWAYREHDRYFSTTHVRHPWKRIARLVTVPGIA